MDHEEAAWWSPAAGRPSAGATAVERAIIALRDHRTTGPPAAPATPRYVVEERRHAVASTSGSRASQDRAQTWQQIDRMPTSPRRKHGPWRRTDLSRRRYRGPTSGSRPGRLRDGRGRSVGPPPDHRAGPTGSTTAPDDAWESKTRLVVSFSTANGQETPTSCCCKSVARCGYERTLITE